jgi:predicted ATPase/class 3 adenylate cyclase
MTASSRPSTGKAHVIPTGTVTFLFSDIEDSTQRWETHREMMDAAVKRHDAHMRDAIEAHGGHVFKTMGDAFCATFARVSDAVSACVDAQRALNAEDFSAVGGLHIRCALHAGEATERDGDYFGPAVNRVARLISIGHGGQILLSGVTRDLAHDSLPDGTTLVDLGSQRLHDLTEPEHVWQLDVAGLPGEFPPLRSLDALPNNLPIQRTAFVGREQDVAEVRELLDRYRLLTLVGSGGVGKTRLAIQIGAELLDRYPDGVWFVDLAPITDGELVASVVAQALGMSQQQGGRVHEAIPSWLRRKQLLLIFDNCEHVLEPIAALTDAILATAQDVRIFATSRQGLNVSGEAVHRLPSLAVPAKAADLKTDEALRYGAVALFVDRAKAADTRFAFTDENVSIIAEICRQLDGIALAIELAAARVKVLSIPNLEQRLNERFKLLTGGSRTTLPRQKTLSATIDWSYDLLAPQEQLLFARLGIFAGGFGLDAVAAVCGGDGLDEIDIFDPLTSLTDKSLVVADTSRKHERYRLLESTAAYALEKLSVSGERQPLARRHAEYFREQAEGANERYGSGSTIAWRAGVEPELDNYRAALEWALTKGNDAVLGGAIAGALERLWSHAGLIAEGRYWIGLALPRVSEAEHPATVARLQLALGWLLSGKRQHDAAQHALGLYQTARDVRGSARAQQLAGFALFRMGRLDEARETTAHALATSRTCGDAWNAARCISNLAAIEVSRGDFRAGRELFAQALSDWKALGDEVGPAHVLGNMGELEFAMGDPERALHFANEALDLASLGKNLQSIANAHVNSAAYRIALADLSGARESARKGLRATREVRHELQFIIALQHLALLAALSGDTRSGAQLLGYVDAQYDQLGNKREPAEQWGYDKLLAALHETLNEDEFKKLAADGAAWSEEQAVEEAMKV